MFLPTLSPHLSPHLSSKEVLACWHLCALKRVPKIQCSNSVRSLAQSRHHDTPQEPHPVSYEVDLGALNSDQFTQDMKTCGPTSEPLESRLCLWQDGPFQKCEGHDVSTFT